MEDPVHIMAEPFTLHVVALDVPYPPDYGGAMDMYFRLAALKRAGVKVILHCFVYRRPPHRALDVVCDQVWYYKRPLYSHLFSTQIPYIVASRRSDQLLDRLMEDSHPILFEGIHTTGWLDHPGLQNRIRVVRMHNVEHLYYAMLADQRPVFWKRWFFQWESRRLKRWANVLGYANGLVAISAADAAWCGQWDAVPVMELPPMAGMEMDDRIEGSGKYALYHGNLAVVENLESVRFLIQEVFSAIRYPLIIAGKNPPDSLYKAAASFPHIRIIANPGAEEMDEIIRQAHIVLIPGRQITGMKLKLVQSLYRARHVLLSRNIAQSALLEDCPVADAATEWQRQVLDLMEQPLSRTDVEKRKILLKERYDDDVNIQRLLSFIQHLNGAVAVEGLSRQE